MKDIKYLIFSFICIFTSTIVLAKDEITIEKMIPLYDENSGVIVKEDNGEHSVIFNDKDQNVKYNIVLKNNTNKDIPVESISLTKPTESFLKYELTGLNSKEVLKSNSTKEVTITLETIKKEGWGRNFNDELITTLILENPFKNPNTSSSSIITILLFTAGIAIIVVICSKKYKFIRYSVLLLTLSSIIPITKADDVLTMHINIKASFESKNIMQPAKDENNNFVDYWIYRNQIKNFYIENEFNEITDYAYKMDVSEQNSERVIAYLVENNKDSAYYDLYLQADGIIYPNLDSSAYFLDMKELDTIKNIEGLDTSNVTNMSQMFENTGSLSEVFTLDLSSFNTSKVTNMSKAFYLTGKNCKVFTLNISNFDTSNVTDMSTMFSGVGYSNPNFTLDVSNFDTSKVTNMSDMFSGAGYSSPIFTIDVSNFDTSNVTNMRAMFANAGYKNPNFTLDFSNFNTSKVTSMYRMFDRAGFSNEEFYLDLRSFDTSSVQDMRFMFANVAYTADKIKLDLSSFDTSNVQYMSSMFESAGFSSSEFDLDLSNFNTSKVTDMSAMFIYTAFENPNFTLTLGKNFKTGQAHNMIRLFYGTGNSSTKMKTSITIENTNARYTKMFQSTAIQPGSQITVNYTSETSDLVDQMIATKSEGANVVKGVQVD